MRIYQSESKAPILLLQEIVLRNVQTEMLRSGKEQIFEILRKIDKFFLLIYM
jgi:hypothetical protein